MMEIQRFVMPSASGLTPSGLMEIRRFSDVSIQKTIDAALAALPDGVNGAVLQITSQPDGTNSAVAAKLGEHWSIVAGYGYRRSGPDVIGAEVLWSW